MTISKWFWLALVGWMLAGCSSKYDYVQEYQRALQSYQGVQIENPEAVKQRFVDFFDELPQDQDIEKTLHEFYAKKLYFNDTLHSAYDRDTLLEYMKETAARLDRLNVTIMNVTHSGQDLYVIWLMEIGYSSMGDEVEGSSIGMTHLRVNEQGKVVLHQDYWDSVQGFYRHVPVLGPLIEKVRGAL